MFIKYHGVCKFAKMSHLNLGAKNQITNLKEKENCEKKSKNESREKMRLFCGFSSTVKMIDYNFACKRKS